MKYYLIAIGFFCLSICACKKHKDSTPASRLPASFTGMKTWRDADQPSSTYRYQFAVKTSGKDEVIINGNTVVYRSTDSLKAGYILKYEGGPPRGTAIAGHSSATFIHTSTGDTIYYEEEADNIGRPSAGSNYVTP